jgi:hypothetical protein
MMITEGRGIIEALSYLNSVEQRKVVVLGFA